MQIKKLSPKHTCGRNCNSLKVSTKQLSKKYANHIRSDLAKTVNAFMNDVKRDYKVEVSRSKTYRTKRAAIVDIYEDYAKKYSQIWNYTKTLKHYNEGTIVKVKNRQTCLIIMSYI